MKKEPVGSLISWTPESVSWYEEASAFTGYHQKLAAHVIKQLDPQFECCELACGTGALARVLAPSVKSYAANDIDISAAHFVEGQLRKNPVAGLSFEGGDWHRVFAGRTFDAVIFSFFGAVLFEWDKVAALARRKVIAVLPRERKGHRKSLTQACAGDRMPVRNYETAQDADDFFTRNGIAHTVEELDLEFGQPCADLAHAVAYVKYYYRLGDSEAAEFARRKFVPAGDGYFFSKVKKIAIVTADLT